MCEQTAPPPVVPVGDERPSRELRHRVRDHLAEGRIVGLPTETVYGLAARADDEEALARLRELKGRDPSLALTWHVDRREVVEGFEPLRPLARRLVQRYWPGPLTLVLQGVPPGLEGIARDGWTGLRLPAHEATRGILADLDFPVAMTSANPSGEAPATRADEVAERFPEGVALILDGGPPRLGEPSGVLQLGRGHFELLREGLLPIDDLRRAAGLAIGFVCTGNTCRSPMAEGLSRHLLAGRLGTAPDGSAPALADFGFHLTSMGLAAGPGLPASLHAVDVMAEQDIDLREHRSSSAVPERLAELDRVYCLTRSHLEGVRSLLPPRRGPRVELLDPEGEDVPDPIGGSRDEYLRCAKRIAAAIQTRADDWA